MQPRVIFKETMPRKDDCPLVKLIVIMCRNQLPQGKKGDRGEDDDICPPKTNSLTGLHQWMKNTQTSYWQPFCCSYQRWHVSTVHLTHCDLLLSRWHCAHAERLCANGAWADHPWQRHWAVLHPTHAIKLLLKDGGPAGTQKVTASINVKTPHFSNDVLS